MKPLMPALLIIASTLPVYAETAIRVEAGAKALIADDEGGLQHYYKGFALARLAADTADLQLTFSRLQHYTITDTLGAERTISLNQPELAAGFHPGRLVSLSAAYSWTGGDSDYTAHRAETGINIYPGNATIGMRGSFRKTAYDYHGSITYRRFSGEFSACYDTSDLVTIDTSYTLDHTDYRTFGYTLTEHRLRASVIIGAGTRAYLFTGAGAGRDSDDTTELMGDAGFSVRLANHLRLTGTYCCTVNIIPSSETTGGSGRSGRSATTSGTDTDIIHTGSFGVSLYW